MRDIMIELAYLELEHVKNECAREMKHFKDSLLLEHHLKQTNFITEAQCISVSNRKIQSLNEANLETFKQSFAKFSQTIQAMVQKFMQYSGSIMEKNKAYLINMKNAILTPTKGENMPIEMRNYPEGIRRITTNFPPFDAVKMRIRTPGDPNACKLEVQKIIMPTYTNSNVEFKEYCKAYFQGGSNKISTNINAINMQGVYNYCANFQNIMNTINGNITTVQSIEKFVANLGNNAGQMTAANAAIQAQNASADISIGYSSITEAPNQDNGRMVIDKSKNNAAVPNQPQQQHAVVQQQTGGCY